MRRPRLSKRQLQKDCVGLALLIPLVLWLVAKVVLHLDPHSAAPWDCQPAEHADKGMQWRDWNRTLTDFGSFDEAVKDHLEWQADMLAHVPCQGIRSLVLVCDYAGFGNCITGKWPNGILAAMHQSRVLLVDQWDLGSDLLALPAAWDLKAALARGTICPSASTTQLHIAGEPNRWATAKRMMTYLPFRNCYGFGTLLLSSQYWSLAGRTHDTIVSLGYGLPPDLNGFAAPSWQPEALEWLFRPSDSAIVKVAALNARRDRAEPPNSRSDVRLCVHLRFGDYDKKSAMFLDFDADFAQIVEAISQVAFGGSNSSKMEVAIMSDFTKVPEHIAQALRIDPRFQRNVHVVPPLSRFASEGGALDVDSAGHSMLLALADLMQCQTCVATIGTYFSSFSTLCESLSRAKFGGERAARGIQSRTIVSRLCENPSTKSQRAMQDCPV